MSFQLAYHTDRGIKKKTNQDALLLKTAKTPKGEIGLFVVCDGMGGLSQGELASATVVKGMSDWFREVLPKLTRSEQFESIVSSAIIECIEELNQRILEFGKANHIQLGTTITALLIVRSRYYLVQVGDSRAYKIHDQLLQLTQDQTLVARELARGNITEEQAKIDPRRNVLLQCIGASPVLEVDVSEGEVRDGDVFLLCTDGFYHEVSSNEILANVRPDKWSDEPQMKNTVIQLVDLVKQRNEQDNITVLTIKVAATAGETP